MHSRRGIWPTCRVMASVQKTKHRAPRALASTPRVHASTELARLESRLECRLAPSAAGSRRTRDEMPKGSVIIPDLFEDVVVGVGVGFWRRRRLAAVARLWHAIS